MIATYVLMCVVCSLLSYCVAKVARIGVIIKASVVVLVVDVVVFYFPQHRLQHVSVLLLVVLVV